MLGVVATPTIKPGMEKGCEVVATELIAAMIEPTTIAGLR